MVAHPDDDESDSALCMYPLNSINQQLMDIISACYSDSGEISGVPAVDVPYSSQTYTACTSKISVSASLSADSNLKECFEKLRLV